MKIEKGEKRMGNNMDMDMWCGMEKIERFGQVTWHLCGGHEIIGRRTKLEDGRRFKVAKGQMEKVVMLGPY